jgi:hypothetical protein
MPEAYEGGGMFRSHGRKLLSLCIAVVIQDKRVTGREAAARHVNEPTRSQGSGDRPPVEDEIKVTIPVSVPVPVPVSVSVSVSVSIPTKERVPCETRFVLARTFPFTTLFPPRVVPCLGSGTGWGWVDRQVQGPLTFPPPISVSVSVSAPFTVPFTVSIKVRIEVRTAFPSTHFLSKTDSHQNQNQN